MKAKKIMSIAMCMALASSVFAACGSTGNSGADNGGAAGGEAAADGKILKSIADIDAESLKGTTVTLYTHGGNRVLGEEKKDENGNTYRDDGCTKMQEIRYISVPFIRKVLFINILLSVSGSIQVFEIPYIMLNGSNGTSTPVIMIQQSMSENRAGFAAALSVLVFVIVIIVVGLQKLLVKEE
ncbi:MAG: ABC transporter permease subunit [Oscillospiraceae bacterium]|nr:ABC transporter permease subunit [Oscillospiraceae bacterium]